MRAERRHELQTNTLAEYIAEAVQYIRDRWQWVVVAALAVAVLAAVSAYWRYSANVRRQQGWTALLALMNTSSLEQPDYLNRLEQLARSYRDPALKAMAWAQLGARLLEEADNAELKGDSKAAEGYRRRAELAFQTTLKQSGWHRDAVAIARLGLAALYERRGDFDAAKAQYEAILTEDRFDQTPYQAQALEKVAELARLRDLPALAAASQPSQARTSEPKAGS